MGKLLALLCPVGVGAYRWVLANVRLVVTIAIVTAALVCCYASIHFGVLSPESGPIKEVPVKQ